LAVFVRGGCARFGVVWAADFAFGDVRDRLAAGARFALRRPLLANTIGLPSRLRASASTVLTYAFERL
jgi:hypothetical protein